MKKLLTVMTIMIAGFLFGGVALAGDYHEGDTLFCNECHVMHFSQSHGYNANGTGNYTVLGTSGPYHYLLRNDFNDLCLSCHDGSGSDPDVLGANTGSNVRQAGALNRGNASPYFDATGHTLDATDTAPGGTWAPDGTLGLICIDCHQPHGRKATIDGTPTSGYRNLWRDAPFPTFGTIVTYAVGTNDATKDVFERVAANYDYDNVDLNEPDTTNSGFATWCKDCHTDFHGAVGGTEIGGSTTDGEFVRHPSAGVDIGAIGGGHSNANIFRTGANPAADPTNKTNFVKVMSANGWYDVDGNATEITGLTPTCISCHKGHGNQNSFGLIHMENTGTITEEGTSTGAYKDLCKQCHVQG